VSRHAFQRAAQGINFSIDELAQGECDRRNPPLRAREIEGEVFDLF